MHRIGGGTGIGRRCAGWLAALALLAATAAPAAVFRCERGGRLVFTDVACFVGATPETIRAPNAMDTTAGAALARRWDERMARERGRRAAAEGEWLEAFEAGREKARRVRRGRVRGQVVEGMSAAQVRQVLGEPDEISRSGENGRERERWRYAGDQATRTVTLADGEVTSVRESKARRRQQKR